MKKFVCRLVAAVTIMIVVVAVMYLPSFFAVERQIDDVYTIPHDTEVLFIGASNVGYSIYNDPGLKMKIIWVSGTCPLSILMRLRELERRRQLESVKVCIIPIDITSFSAQTNEKLNWALYKELPLSLRHSEMFPEGRLAFAAYILRNLRPRAPFAVTEEAPDRPGMPDNSANHRDYIYRLMKKEATELVHLAEDTQEAARRLLDCVERIKELCDRHGIRLVAFRPPYLPSFRNSIPRSCWDEFYFYVKRLKDMSIEFVEMQLDLGEEYFFDHKHLTEAGAKIFTEKLIKELHR